MSDEPLLSSAAKVTAKKIGFAPEGILTLKDGRFSFETKKKVVFDVPLEGVTDLTWPSISMGTVCRFNVDGKRYSCDFSNMNLAAQGAFVRMGGAVGGLAVVGMVGNVRRAKQARELGQIWRECLEREMAGTNPASSDSPG
jgi:hypothetical protein